MASNSDFLMHQQKKWNWLLIWCVKPPLIWPPSLSNLAQVQKGANASRADDTKGMKGMIIDWITPQDQAIVPPLNRKVKFNRGFHHEVTGSLLCPAGVDWADPE